MHHVVTVTLFTQPSVTPAGVPGTSTGVLPILKDGDFPSPVVDFSAQKEYSDLAFAGSNSKPVGDE